MDVKGTTVRKKGRASGETEGILISGMSTVFVNDFKSPFKYQFDYCYEKKARMQMKHSLNQEILVLVFIS